MPRGGESQARLVLKNTGAGLGAGAVAFAVDLGVLALLGRYLGVSGFGTYVFVMSFVRAFQVVGDLGLRSILLREVAGNRRNVEGPLRIACTLVLALSVVAMVSIIAFVHLLGYGPAVVQLTVLAGLTLVTNLHAHVLGAVCRAFEEMEFNAIAHGLERCLFLALLIVVARFDLGLPAVFAGALIAGIAQWGFYYTVVSRRYARPGLTFDLAGCLAMAREAFPAGLGVTLRRLGWHADTVLLAQLATMASAGLFNAGYKVTAFVQQLTVTLSHPFAPVYAKRARAELSWLGEAYEKSLRFVWVIGVPVAVGIGMFAESIVGTLFGRDFAPAARALQVQSVAILLLFPSSLYLGLFTAVGQQRLYMRLAAVSLVVNVGLDVLLIPRYTYMGASVATVLAEAGFLLGGAGMLHRLGLQPPLLTSMMRPLLAGTAMALVLYGLREASALWLGPVAVLALLLYAAVLRLTGAVTASDLQLVRASLPLGRWRAGFRLRP